MNRYKYVSTISNYYEYSDVNKDPKLRKMMVDYFTKKIDKWLSSSKEYKNELKIYHEKDIINIKNEYLNNNRIYKILRDFVNKHTLNWYDLKKYKSNIKKKILKYLKVINKL